MSSFKTKIKLLTNKNKNKKTLNEQRKLIIKAGIYSQALLGQNSYGFFKYELYFKEFDYDMDLDKVLNFFKKQGFKVVICFKEKSHLEEFAMFTTAEYITIYW